MDLALALPADGPRRVRLVEALREAILSGRLAAGARLPASRTLAAQLGLARGTVVAAYEELVSEGYCISHVGAGTYVVHLTPRPPSLQGKGEIEPEHVAPSLSGDRAAAAPAMGDHSRLARTPAAPPPSLACLPRRAGGKGAGGGSVLSAWGARLQVDASLAAQPPLPVRYDFRSGVAAEVFPAAALARALRRAALGLTREGGVGDPAGSVRLRRALVAHLGRARGLRADASQVLVVGGSQQGLDLTARLLLDPGDRVCVEQPGYPRANRVFRALGADLAPLPVDSSGLVTTALPHDGARLVYVTPSHQHPTGAVLSPDRRLALLAWAEAHDAWVLEDDYDSEFRYGGPPLPCLQGLDRSGRCLYLGSLSKLLHPSLRAGYLVVPPALVPAAVAAKSTLDQATTPIIQEALADLFESGEIDRHLRRAGRAYRDRRARLLAACARYLPGGVRVWPVTGGVHAFIEVAGTGPEQLQVEAAARGVALTFATDGYAEPPPDARIILWFARVPADQIAPAIAALADAIQAVRVVAHPVAGP